MKTLLLFSLIAFATTFLGSLIPLWKEAWSKKHLWHLLAFSSGVLLSISFLHLVPEGLELAGTYSSIAMLLTFVLLFAGENVTMVHACEDFITPTTPQPRAFVPIVAMGALSFHALLDGMAIGIALQRNVFLGSVISIGVILHKFSDGLTLTSLLKASHYQRKHEILWAGILALATPVGAFLSYFVTGHASDPLVGVVLGVTAGSFVYVGAADLLPRLHEAHDRSCLAYLGVGVLAVLIFSH